MTITSKGRGRYIFGIIAVNGYEIVVVEVKTTLKSDNITHFISKLKSCKGMAS